MTWGGHSWLQPALSRLLTVGPPILAAAGLSRRLWGKGDQRRLKSRLPPKLAASPGPNYLENCSRGGCSQEWPPHSDSQRFMKTQKQVESRRYLLSAL